MTKLRAPTLNFDDAQQRVTALIDPFQPAMASNWNRRIIARKVATQSMHMRAHPWGPVCHTLQRPNKHPSSNCTTGRKRIISGNPSDTDISSTTTCAKANETRKQHATFTSLEVCPSRPILEEDGNHFQGDAYEPEVVFSLLIYCSDDRTCSRGSAETQSAKPGGGSGRRSFDVSAKI